MQKRKIYILHLFGAISTSLLTLAILLSLSSCLEYQNTAFQWQINPAVEQVNTWNPWKPTNYIINDRQGHLYMTGQRISPASKLAVATLRKSTR